MTIKLPEQVYQELVALSQETNTNPTTLITQWVEESKQQRRWRQAWRELRERVQSDGGYPQDETIDSIVDQMRKTRAEVFEAEYAHLYR
ncbi:MAG: hypothetical protein IPK16_21975 [Anaerolineales bacterium]|nr:hypothetical protein [Anaerolineales bacterium]